MDIADLLGRDEVDFGGDAELARFVTGRRILITGAGGTIGGELARQVARLSRQGTIDAATSDRVLAALGRPRQLAAFARQRAEADIAAGAPTSSPAMPAPVAERVGARWRSRR